MIKLFIFIINIILKAISTILIGIAGWCTVLTSFIMWDAKYFEDFDFMEYLWKTGKYKSKKK